MTSNAVDTLNLTHTGLFSERANAILSSILSSRGDTEISMGTGARPSDQQMCVMIALRHVSTAFTPKEARGLIEIIESTIADEEPPTRSIKKMLNHIATGCRELSAEIEEFERLRTEKQLN